MPSHSPQFDFLLSVAARTCADLEALGGEPERLRSLGRHGVENLVATFQTACEGLRYGLPVLPEAERRRVSGLEARGKRLCARALRWASVHVQE